MKTIDFNDLRRHPEVLLDSVEAGETLVISRDGDPVAELRLLATPVQGLRPFGLCAGEFTVPDDFDSPLSEDILHDFEGR